MRLQVLSMCVCEKQEKIRIFFPRLINCYCSCRKLYVDQRVLTGVLVVKVISGVLVRLTTCKRLTKSLPRLSLITLSPPETAGENFGRIYGRTCHLSKPFHSLGYQGEYFPSSTWGKSENFIIVDGGDRTYDPKTHGLSTTPFVKELVGY